MRANNNNHIFYYVYQPKGIAIKDPIKSHLQRFPSEFRPQGLNFRTIPNGGSFIGILITTSLMSLIRLTWSPANDAELCSNLVEHVESSYLGTLPGWSSGI